MLTLKQNPHMFFGIFRCGVIKVATNYWPKIQQDMGSEGDRNKTTKYTIQVVAGPHPATY
jgi:hypothetical protein